MEEKYSNSKISKWEGVALEWGLRRGGGGGGVLLNKNTPSRCHTCTINFTFLLLSFYRLYFSLTTQETSRTFYNVTTLTTANWKVDNYHLQYTRVPSNILAPLQLHCK